MVRARLVERDNSLAHQIVLFVQNGTHRFGVSCLCQKKSTGVYVAFETRGQLEGHEARAIWLSAKHNEERGLFDHNAIAAARRGTVVWAT